MQSPHFALSCVHVVLCVLVVVRPHPFVRYVPSLAQARERISRRIAPSCNMHGVRAHSFAARVAETSGCSRFVSSNGNTIFVPGDAPSCFNASRYCRLSVFASIVCATV